MSENVWYVCMYCRRAYQDPQRLIEHKKANHWEAFMARKEARQRERNNKPPKIAVVHPRASQDEEEDENIVDQNEDATEDNMEVDQDIQNKSMEETEQGQENVDEEMDSGSPVQDDDENFDDDAEMNNESAGESDNEVDSEAETLDSETARAETEEDFIDEDDDADNPGPVSPISPQNPEPPASENFKAPENEASSETSDDSDKTVLINNATELIQDESSSSSAIAGSVQPSPDDPSRQQPAIKMRLKRSAKSTYSIDRSIKCPKCPKSFKNIWGLGVHTRVIHREKHAGSMKVKCSVCSKIFVSSSALYLHARTHNISKKASLQGAEAKGQGTLGVKSTDGPSTETTEDLGGTSGVKSTETAQGQSAESQETTEDNGGSDTWFYQCKFGDGIRPTTAIKRVALARQRNSTRRRADKYKCDRCDLEFTSPTTLMVHRRSHMFNCNYCVKSFDTLEQAENHKRLHTFDRTLLCPYCPKTFAYPSPLAKHVAKNHPDGMNVVAEEPGPSTRSQTAAAKSPARPTQHSAPSSQSQAASSQSPRPVQCTPGRTKAAKVPAKIPAAKKLKDVKRSMRKRRKKVSRQDITCRFCHRLCQSPSHLIKHESIHTGDRPFKCKYCTRGFVHKSQLATHEASHEAGEEIFTCSLCKFAFCKEWILVQHLKSQHSLDEDKAKILASVKAAAAGPTAGNVTLRARPPPKEVVVDDKEKAIVQILVDGLVQYECNICSGRFSHKTDILAHVHYDHGL